MGIPTTHASGRAQPRLAVQHHSVRHVCISHMTDRQHMCSAPGPVPSGQCRYVRANGGIKINAKGEKSCQTFSKRVKKHKCGERSLGEGKQDA